MTLYKAIEKRNIGKKIINIGNRHNFMLPIIITPLVLRNMVQNNNNIKYNRMNLKADSSIYSGQKI